MLVALTSIIFKDHSQYFVEKTAHTGKLEINKIAEFENIEEQNITNSQSIAKPKKQKTSPNKTSTKKTQIKTNEQLQDLTNNLLLIKNEVKKMAKTQQEMEKKIEVILVLFFNFKPMFIMMKEIIAHFQTITPVQMQSNFSSPNNSQNSLNNSVVGCFVKRQWILNDVNVATCEVYIRLFRNCMCDNNINILATAIETWLLQYFFKTEENEKNKHLQKIKANFRARKTRLFNKFKNIRDQPQLQTISKEFENLKAKFQTVFEEHSILKGNCV